MRHPFDCIFVSDLFASFSAPPSPRLRRLCRVVPARASTNQRRQVYLQRPSCLETIRLSSTQLAVKDSASIPASPKHTPQPTHCARRRLFLRFAWSLRRLPSASAAAAAAPAASGRALRLLPPHVWSQVTRGNDQRSIRDHISSSSGTGHAMPRPNLRPHSRARARVAFAALLCLGVSGWHPSSPRPLRPGIRNDTRGASPTEHERRERGGAATPLPHSIARDSGTSPLALHLWHCTTALSRHGAQPSTHKTTGFTRCTTHLDAPTARSRSVGYTPIHHLSPPLRSLALCRLLPSTISANSQAHALARYSQSFSFSKTRDGPLLRPLLVAVSPPPLMLLMPRPALSSLDLPSSPLDLPTHPSTCPLTPRPALSSLDLPSHPSTCPPRVRVARRDKLVETFAQPLAGLSSSLAVLIDVD